MQIINNIITYDINEITSDELYERHILNNVPCVIKNYNKKYKEINKYLDISKNHSGEKYIGINASMDKAYEFDSFVKQIKNKTKFGENARRWLHMKGNVTPWHYDGDGCDILNICLAGGKRFYLSKPLSLTLYPLSNIAVSDQYRSDTYVDMVPGDMLFLPRFWFHRVVTTMDNTYNVNYAFISKAEIPFRDKYVYTLHKMCGSEMCKFKDTPVCFGVKQDYFESFMYGLFEMKWIIILYILTVSTLYKYFNVDYMLYGLLFMFIVIFNSSYINKVSLGIINLNAMFLGFITCLMILRRKLYKFHISNSLNFRII